MHRYFKLAYYCISTHMSCLQLFFLCLKLLNWSRIKKTVFLIKLNIIFDTSVFELFSYDFEIQVFWQRQWTMKLSKHTSSSEGCVSCLQTFRMLKWRYIGKLLSSIHLCCMFFHQYVPYLILRSFTGRYNCGSQNKYSGENSMWDYEWLQRGFHLWTRGFTDTAEAAKMTSLQGI